MTPRPAGRRLFAGALAAMALMALPTGCTTGAAELQRAQQILTAGVPDDATPKQVLAYLDRQHIEHTQYERYNIHAVIRERKAPYIFERDYTAEYRFDAHDNLVERVVAIKYGVF